jgi:hypothetical protein
MSLSSLRSLTGAASLATTAIDTARSTLKAMAEAAVTPAGDDATAAPTSGKAAPASKAPAAAAAAADVVATASEAKPSAEKSRGGWIRKGTVLDAYA